MPNRLSEASSPYLLQHKDNPVDWQPWDDRALARAREEQKPIFLSVGYAACHWCHVMEHESFENSRIADLLNRNFVCIKVDREERPDIDQIYMHAVQMLTGSGGWPMSVFLAPDQRPFYGGTYWPPQQRGGMPGFDQILMAVADAWQERRDEVIGQATQLTEHLTASLAEATAGGGGPLSRDWIDRACDRLRQVFDGKNGGFGSAPKFPHAGDLDLLLRQAARTGEGDLLRMVTLTLDKMAAGGIYDHLGGGFARYSVDARWLVPHFEKMLYDNGLLAGVYLRAFQATGEDRYAQVARETLGYLVRDMVDPSGGIHSTEDADSEGEEGKYYVWTPEAIREVLGEPRGRRFCQVYDVTERGNFEGKNILNLPRPIAEWAESFGVAEAALAEELAADRAALLAAREERVRPGRDDKILVSWNALAIDSLALGGRVLNEPALLEAAERAASFLWDRMRREDGRLMHAWRNGTANLDAYLDDYAYLVEALVTLYEATGGERWVERAAQLADAMIQHFSDPAGGGFFYTADDHESLIARTKDVADASVPSSSGSAAYGLLRLARLTGEARYATAAEGALTAGASLMERQPAAAAKLLAALDLYTTPPTQIVVAAPDASSAGQVAEAYFRGFRPDATLARVVGTPDADGPLGKLVEGKRPVDGQVTLYRCENFTCAAPVAGEAECLELLAG